jgi:WD40 repeat protein
VFTPDGKRLIVSANDQIVRTFDVATTNEVAAFRTISTSADSLTLSPDGKVLAVGRDGEHMVQLYHAANGKLWGYLPSPKSLTPAMAISPSGEVLAAGGDDGVVRLWAMPKPKEK